MKTCKCIILIIVLSVSTIVSAQFTLVEQPNSDLGSSMPSGMASGSGYTSTVYDAGAYNIFETPAETEQRVAANARRGFITPGDINQSNESPIGAPWVMLVFAALAAGWAYLRHHRQQA